MSLSGLAQFILGFLLGVFILAGAGAATAYWFFNRLSDRPPQPDFAEETSSQSSQKQQASNDQQQQSKDKQQSQSNKQQKQSTSQQEKSSEQTASNANQSQTSSSDQTIEERFGEQAYQARVTWPNGLSLRDSPSADSSRVGGVYYNDKLVILEKSSDEDWQKVYVPETGQTAWVKAGNVEKIN